MTFEGLQADCAERGHTLACDTLMLGLDNTVLTVEHTPSPAPGQQIGTTAFMEIESRRDLDRRLPEIEAFVRRQHGEPITAEQVFFIVRRKRRETLLGNRRPVRVEIGASVACEPPPDQLCGLPVVRVPDGASIEVVSR